MQCWPAWALTGTCPVRSSSTDRPSCKVPSGGDDKGQWCSTIVQPASPRPTGTRASLTNKNCIGSSDDHEDLTPDHHWLLCKHQHPCPTDHAITILTMQEGSSSLRCDCSAAAVGTARPARTLLAGQGSRLGNLHVNPPPQASSKAMLAIMQKKCAGRPLARGD